MVTVKRRTCSKPTLLTFLWQFGTCRVRSIYSNSYMQIFLFLIVFWFFLKFENSFLMRDLFLVWIFRILRSYGTWAEERKSLENLSPSLKNFLKQRFFYFMVDENLFFSFTKKISYHKKFIREEKLRLIFQKQQEIIGVKKKDNKWKMIVHESHPFYQFWDFINSLLFSLNTSDPFLRGVAFVARQGEVTPWWSDVSRWRVLLYQRS